METFLLNHKLDMAYDYNDSIRDCVPMIDGNASDDDEKDYFGRMYEDTTEFATTYKEYRETIANIQKEIDQIERSQDLEKIITLYQKTQQMAIKLDSLNVQQNAHRADIVQTAVRKATQTDDMDLDKELNEPILDLIERIEDCVPEI